MPQNTDSIELEFKPDFEEARQRWAAFWQGESDRPLLHAIAPKAGVEPIPMPRPYAFAFGDVDALADQVVGWASTHDFLADTIPSFMVTLAPDHFAALLGCEIKQPIHGGSNWVEPCAASLEQVDISFKREGHWWRRTVECAEKLRARCDGKLIITSTHFQGGLDCLAAMCGTQETLMALALSPDVVKQALAHVDRAVAEVRRAFAELLDVPKWGSANRFHMYNPGIIDVPECDISCMLSSSMFDEFQMPSLTREINGLDASIYHLDGLDAVPHLESICRIESLDMIQWMPGEGHYDDDHAPLNARIDALGKGQIFQGYYKFGAADIQRIWDSFTSRKLFFHVNPEVLTQLPWQ